MRVKDLVDEFGFTLEAGDKALNNDIEGLYCCDLLSWVMSHVKAKEAWITVQTHVNIIAVASLLEVACIIIPESIEVDNDTIIKANEEGIAVLSTDLKAFDIFKRFYEAGIR